ncbi:MAG: hypothetical protein MJB14_18150 [Spirochaetes bacterium]|nr:hypothetical protein [Spirochaetota bacterium]
MKKFILLLAIIYLFCFNIYTKERVYKSMDNNRVIFNYYLKVALPGGIYYQDYQIITKNKVPFLITKENKSFDIEQQDFIFLHNDLFIYYSDNQSGSGLMLNKALAERDPGADAFFNGNINDTIPKFTVTASSVLEEGKKRHSAERITYSSEDGAWVEGKPGPGLGEFIILEFDTAIHTLIISNGFVSVERPELYEYNNRIKKIRVSSNQPDFSFDAELKDNANFQMLTLPKETKKVKLKIHSIYKGSKWDDTCLNYVSGIRMLSDYRPLNLSLDTAISDGMTFVASSESTEEGLSDYTIQFLSNNECVYKETTLIGATNGELIVKGSYRIEGNYIILDLKSGTKTYWFEFDLEPPEPKKVNAQQLTFYWVPELQGFILHSAYKIIKKGEYDYKPMCSQYINKHDFNDKIGYFHRE